MPSLLDVPELSGRLDPLARGHVDALVAAAAADGATYGYTPVPRTRAAMLAQQDAGELVPFAQVRLADRRPVGITSYLAIR